MPVMTMIQAVQVALREEMARDERVVMLGEDIARNGGVFRATEGLLDRFGEARVIDTPLNESGIVGVAIGMAMNGLRPVAEIQFADFIYPAFDQIVSELAKLRYRSGGEFTCPVVIRTPYGGGIRGGGYHSQSPEAYFVHTAGLHVYVPSTPADALGLLRSAIRGADPVIFFEPKKVYRQPKEEVPDDPDFVVRPGEARLAREGDSCVLVAWGAMTHVCLEAAALAAERGVECAVLDLRTLVPMDVEAILAQVRRTGRVVVVHEAPRTCGVGAEIAALVADRAIDSLEAPVLRVTGFDTPFPYALEHVYMPSPERVLAAVEKVARY
ncbi:MAG TPA: alpha-ketoacid dehydrogenase subunit beta [Planctomycetota bacterium]|nr:alpha-ketoacid dehydrogenase subunit beta [Planctomycetota bacterium]